MLGIRFGFQPKFVLVLEILHVLLPGIIQSQFQLLHNFSYRYITFHLADAFIQSDVQSGAIQGHTTTVLCTRGRETEREEKIKKRNDTWCRLSRIP